MWSKLKSKFDACLATNRPLETASTLWAKARILTSVAVAVVMVVVVVVVVVAVVVADVVVSEIVI